MRGLAVAVTVVCLVPGALFAQAGTGGEVVQGRVVSAAGAPLAAVSVALRSAADSAVVAGDLTGPSGRFRVERVAPGRYFVVAELLGYARASRPAFEVAAGATSVDIGTLTLVSQAIALEEHTQGDVLSSDDTPQERRER